MSLETSALESGEKDKNECMFAGVLDSLWFNLELNSFRMINESNS